MRMTLGINFHHTSNGCHGSHLVRPSCYVKICYPRVMCLDQGAHNPGHFNMCAPILVLCMEGRMEGGREDGGREGGREDDMSCVMGQDCFSA